RAVSRVVTLAVQPATYYAALLLLPPPPSSTLFPYTTLFRSAGRPGPRGGPPPASGRGPAVRRRVRRGSRPAPSPARRSARAPLRSEEHTSELQSRFDLVCRLLLEKKNEKDNSTYVTNGRNYG